MVSTYTPNIQLEEPARGDYVGTWDTPVNSNMTLIDLVSAGLTTINAAAGSVVLAAAQFQCETIVINSTLLASITLTFPTSFTKQYTIYHNATGSSAFTITLGTTSASGNVLCAIPGEYIDVINLGSAGIVYKNLGRVGSYVDIATSSMPNWVTGCTLPPYLACTGATFSSASYPQLATILGSTTLPDMRGRTRIALDAGAGRVSSASAGFSPDTVAAGGGAQSVTLATSQIPAHTHANTLTDPGHSHFGQFSFNGSGGGAAITIVAGGFGLTQSVQTSTTGISITNASAGGGGAHSVMQPTLAAGITMIRAA